MGLDACKALGCFWQPYLPGVNGPINSPKGSIQRRAPPTSVCDTDTICMRPGTLY